MKAASSSPVNNIQATISAFGLVKSMSINSKSVQKSEIECKSWNWVQKKVKCNAVKLKWLTAPTLSSDKQNGGQKLNEDWNSLSKCQQNYLINNIHEKITRFWLAENSVFFP